MKIKSIAEDAGIFNFSVEDHDIIIFSGDLNYRIAEDVDINTVYEHIDQPETCHELLSFDQLNIERQHGRIFQGFSEGEIRFLPTYQFICGSSLYDRRPEKKMRCPAWCDRILYRQGRYPSDSNYNTSINDLHNSNRIGTHGYYASLQKGLDLNHSFETIQLLSYESLPEFVISDHAPVRACFAITVKRMDYAMRELSMLEAIESEFNTFESRTALNLPSTTCNPTFSNQTNHDADYNDSNDDNLNHNVSADLIIDEKLSQNPYIQSMHRYPALEIIPKYVTLLPASANQKTAKVKTKL